MADAVDRARFYIAQAIKKADLTGARAHVDKLRSLLADRCVVEDLDDDELDTAKNDLAKFEAQVNGGEQNSALGAEMKKIRDLHAYAFEQVASCNYNGAKVYDKQVKDAAAQLKEANAGSSDVDAFVEEMNAASKKLEKAIKARKNEVAAKEVVDRGKSRLEWLENDLNNNNCDRAENWIEQIKATVEELEYPAFAALDFVASFISEWETKLVTITKHIAKTRLEETVRGIVDRTENFLRWAQGALDNQNVDQCLRYVQQARDKLAELNTEDMRNVDTAVAFLKDFEGRASKLLADADEMQLMAEIRDIKDRTNTRLGWAKSDLENRNTERSNSYLEQMLEAMSPLTDDAKYANVDGVPEFVKSIKDQVPEMRALMHTIDIDTGVDGQLSSAKTKMGWIESYIEQKQSSNSIRQYVGQVVEVVATIVANPEYFALDRVKEFSTHVTIMKPFWLLKAAELDIREKLDAALSNNMSVETAERYLDESKELLKTLVEDSDLATHPAAVELTAAVKADFIKAMENIESIKLKKRAKQLLSAAEDIARSLKSRISSTYSKASSITTDLASLRETLLELEDEKILTVEGVSEFVQDCRNEEKAWEIAASDRLKAEQFKEKWTDVETNIYNIERMNADYVSRNGDKELRDAVDKAMNDLAEIESEFTEVPGATSSFRRLRAIVLAARSRFIDQTMAEAETMRDRVIEAEAAIKENLEHDEAHKAFEKLSVARNDIESLSSPVYAAIEWVKDFVEEFKQKEATLEEEVKTAVGRAEFGKELYELLALSRKLERAVSSGHGEDARQVLVKCESGIASLKSNFPEIPSEASGPISSIEKIMADSLHKLGTSAPQAAVDPSQWVCNEHRLPNHTFFISYRVATDATLATQLQLELEMFAVRRDKEIHGFLDQKCLNVAEDWEIGFLNGLSGSKVIVYLVSEPGLQIMKRNAESGAGDNVLLEIERGLELHEQGKVILLPIFVGSVDGPSGLIKKFSAFGLFNGVDAVHAKSGKSVRDTMRAFFKLQGMSLNDPSDRHGLVRDVYEFLESRAVLKGM